MLDELNNLHLYNQRAESFDMGRLQTLDRLVIFVYPNNRNEEFISILKNMNSLGVHRVAINTDTVDNNLNISAIHKIGFDIYSDPSKIASRRLGVISTTRVNDEEREMFVPTIFLFIQGKLEKKSECYNTKDYSTFLSTVEDRLK
ncbi:MAG: peroxiredoxin family protein [Candidatus Micrarchaeota archaeon]|nr:peroxiredoxin family protein [Candidatus Micrarchaeota archaeon]